VVCAFCDEGEKAVFGQLSLKLSLPRPRHGLLRDNGGTTLRLLAKSLLTGSVGYLHNSGVIRQAVHRAYARAADRVTMPIEWYERHHDQKLINLQAEISQSRHSSCAAYG